MVLSWALFAMAAAALAAGALTGRMGEVSAAMLAGSAEAVQLAVSLAGPMSLWSAVQCAMERAGLSAKLARLFGPLLRALFPQAGRDPEASAAISQNFCANLLGLGNAATPMGIRAVRRMGELSGTDRASDEMCRLVVLNTASIQLLPTTVAAARATLGAPHPYAILPAVWLTSLLSVTAGLLAARALARYS